MRDAFGGVFMIRLLLIFILIYVIFTSLALNYAKAFRIKNEVISYIEEQELLSLDHLSNNFIEGLKEVLDKAKYEVTCPSEQFVERLDKDRVCLGGVIVTKKPNVGKVLHYEVKTFVFWNLDSLKFLFNLSGNNPDAKDVKKGSWEITGEAKVVKRL